MTFAIIMKKSNISKKKLFFYIKNCIQCRLERALIFDTSLVLRLWKIVFEIVELQLDNIVSAYKWAVRLIYVEIAITEHWRILFQV